MIPKAKILVVDDDKTFRDLLTDVLQFDGYEVIAAANGQEALQAIENELPGLVLLDFALPDLDGIAVLKRALKSQPGLAVVLVSGQATIKRAVEATKLGAYDFLEKPIDTQRLLLTVKNTLEATALRKKHDHSLQEAWQKYGMIGGSPAMQKVFALIDALAPVKTPVYISGESGAGKDLVARALHNNSRRKDARFVHVNCAAIPDTLIESALFGHEKGAFTDAHAQKKGYFHLADAGTLFLDEIGDLSLQAQAKILLALERGEIMRVGAEHDEKVDVRLISASNKDLEKLVSRGAFREDLFYRINVIPIQLSPLRTRKEDIFPLAKHFLSSICLDNNLPPRELLPDCESILASQPWQGNARALKNFIEKVIVLTDQKQITGRLLQSALNFPTIDASSPTRETLRQARAAFERSFITTTLKECNGHITKAAEILGIERSHLYRKMEKLRISIP